MLILTSPKIIKMDEIWIDVVGFVPYQISNSGRIRRTYLGRTRIVSLTRRDGRMVVNFHIGNRNHQRILPKIVLEHFGPKKPGHYYDSSHIDDDFTNCEISNLEWIPRAKSRLQKPSSHSSKYHGVSVRLTKKASYRWVARVTTACPCMSTFEKYFPHTPEGEIEAAKWRDTKALEIQGRKATLNFPDIVFGV